MIKVTKERYDYLKRMLLERELKAFVSTTEFNVKLQLQEPEGLSTESEFGDSDLDLHEAHFVFKCGKGYVIPVRVETTEDALAIINLIEEINPSEDN